MANLRCFILACSLATATVAADADDGCGDGDGDCYGLAWPNYADMISTEADVDALFGSTGSSDAHADVIAELVVRRQALRIRGLELRYLIGKTTTSEGEGADKLDHIRHQIASIVEEIGFIDRELAQHLNDFGRRSGPWLVSVADGACTQYWFVPRPPCNGQQDIALQSAVKLHWLETNAQVNVLSVGDLLGTCNPHRLGLRCPAPHEDAPLVLHVDGMVLRFYRGD